MTDIKGSAWAICERVAETQALLHDHTEGGRFTADELVRKLAAIMRAEGLLRAMWEVWYVQRCQRMYNALVRTRAVAALE